MVRLANGYFIDADELNFILRREYEAIDRKTNEQKAAVKTIGYFANIEGAVKRYLKDNQLALTSEMESDIRDYITIIEKFNKLACAEITFEIKKGESGCTNLR